MEQADLLKRFGTDEPPAVLRAVTTGALSFLYSAEGLRRVCWQGTELVRALAWPIRDENWGTYPADLLSETIEDDGNNGFAANLRLAVGDGRLICDLHLSARADGTLLANLTMTPEGGAFSTNRAGFTVLHPIAELAGAALHVSHGDDTAETTVFPKHIQPDQPVKNIHGLRYGLGAQQVDIAFSGETFEMEDQRNWSDASYKTYCVPLVHPFTYTLTGPVRQSVHMRFTGDVAPRADGAGKAAIRIAASAHPTPDIGLAIETGWLPTAPLPDLRASHVLLRTTPGADDLPALAEFARGFTSVDLEIVLPDGAPVEAALHDMAKACAAQNLIPKRVIALPAAYLGSHQPVGPWPEGPTPNNVLGAVRKAFPTAAVGGGVLTNFTELNRCRPDRARSDYITHGLTPLVHAGDDMSVLETLETLPQIFASTQALANGLPCRLGLAGIGMRSNPYGAAVAENPRQVRRTMAQIDPRHRGLFGAAYAVGLLAATEGHAVEALCLGAPAGPFGVVHTSADWPQPGYDGSDRAVYPLFHVIRAASRMAGKPRLTISGLPDGIVAYGAQAAGDAVVMLTNVSEHVQRFDLPQKANALCLDTQTFDAATTAADWLDSAPRSQISDLALEPFSVAFLTIEATNL